MKIQNGFNVDIKNNEFLNDIYQNGLFNHSILDFNKKIKYLNSKIVFSMNNFHNIFGNILKNGNCGDEMYFFLNNFTNEEVDKNYKLFKNSFSLINCGSVYKLHLIENIFSNIIKSNILHFNGNSLKMKKNIFFQCFTIHSLFYSNKMAEFFIDENIFENCWSNIGLILSRNENFKQCHEKSKQCYEKLKQCHEKYPKCSQNLKHCYQKYPQCSKKYPQCFEKVKQCFSWLHSWLWDGLYSRDWRKCFYNRNPCKCNLYSHFERNIFQNCEFFTTGVKIYNDGYKCSLKIIGNEFYENKIPETITFYSYNNFIFKRNIFENSSSLYDLVSHVNCNTSSKSCVIDFNYNYFNGLNPYDRIDNRVLKEVKPKMKISLSYKDKNLENVHYFYETNKESKTSQITYLNDSLILTEDTAIDGNLIIHSNTSKIQISIGKILTIKNSLKILNDEGNKNLIIEYFTGIIKYFNGFYFRILPNGLLKPLAFIIYPNIQSISHVDKLICNYLNLSLFISEYFSFIIK